ncbi:Hypothetical Protein FCC1311_112832, partial [Hondaea fermentalgiana]
PAMLFYLLTHDEADFDATVNNDILIRTMTQRREHDMVGALLECGQGIDPRSQVRDTDLESHSALWIAFEHRDIIAAKMFIFHGLTAVGTSPETDSWTQHVEFVRFYETCTAQHCRDVKRMRMWAVARMIELGVKSRSTRPKVYEELRAVFGPEFICLFMHFHPLEEFRERFKDFCDEVKAHVLTFGTFTFPGHAGVTALAE